MRGFDWVQPAITRYRTDEARLWQRLHGPVEWLRGSLWVQALLTIWLHGWLRGRLQDVCKLPRSAYFEDVLLTELALRGDRFEFLALSSVALLMGARRLRWRDVDPEGHARPLVMAIAGILVWAWVTVDYNLFFDQAYLVDRLAMLVCWGLLWRHPAFVLPLLVALFLAIGQLNYPLWGAHWHWPDKRLPLDFLLLFLSFLYVRPFVKGHRYALLTLTLMLIGAHYWVAALAKFEIGPEPLTWLTENHMSSLLPSSYKNAGWLRFLSEDSLVGLTHGMRHVEMLIAGVSLTIEASGLLLGLHRRVAIVALCSMVLMHVGIVLTSGIFFWKWLLMDLFVAAYIYRAVPAVPTGKPWKARLRDWATGKQAFSLSSTLLVVLAAVYGGESLFAATRFAWWDTTFINYFEVRGTGESGKQYVLDARFFSPYDILMTQARFPYLKKGKYMGSTFGTAYNLQFAKDVEGIGVDELPAVRREYEGRFYRSRSARTFEDFVSRYVENVQKRGKSWWPRYLAPPKHFQSFRVDNHYDGQEPLREVEVFHLEHLYTYDAIEDVGETRVLHLTF